MVPPGQKGTVCQDEEEVGNSLMESQPSAAGLDGHPEEVSWSILESLGEPFHAVTPDLHICKISSAFQEWATDLGFEVTEGKTVFETFPFLSSRVRDEYREVFRSGRPLHTKSSNNLRGTGLLTETSKIPIVNGGRVTHVVTVIRDVTVQRRTEDIANLLFDITRAANRTADLSEFLDTTREQLGRMIDTSNFFVALYDEKNDLYSFPYHVDKYDNSTLLSPQQLRESLTDRVRRTGEPLLLDDEADKKLIEKGEVKLIGTLAHSWLGVPLRTNQGIIGVVVVQSYDKRTTYSTQDLELLSYLSEHVARLIERKQAETALRESEERFRGLFNHANDVIYTHDLDGRFTSLNDTGEEIIGYSREEALEMSIEDIIDPNQQDFIQELLHITTVIGDPATAELQIITKDGQLKTLEVSTRLFHRRGDEVEVLGIARDISERKHLEDQLRQAQKMEAVGQLAGGVAHDFNNLLTVVNGHATLARVGLSARDPVRSHLREIEAASERAANLTKQLLAFSRKQVLTPKVLNLDDVVATTERMLCRLIGANIELVTRLGSSTNTIEADSTQLEQVIVNLAVNARDAMPGGGRLTIETRPISISRSKARRFEGLHPGEYVGLLVSDTGAGIDPVTRERIFEPFFTTKEKGKGTGLGLATVYGIVKQSGGYIYVDSAPGSGSKFSIFFPNVRGDKTDLPHGITQKPTTGGSETILVVEDEEAIRNLIARVLSRIGYQVLQAGMGEEALLVSNRTPGPIHLLLSDVVMPGIGGFELAKRMARIRPEMKVLFMSGYADLRTEGGVNSLTKGAQIFTKPFSPGDLAGKVREILDSTD